MTSDQTSLLLEKLAGLLVVTVVLLTIGLVSRRCLKSTSPVRFLVWTYLLWDLLLVYLFFGPLLFVMNTMPISQQMPEFLLYLPFSLLMPPAYMLGFLWFLGDAEVFLRLGGQFFGTLAVAAAGAHYINGRW